MIALLSSPALQVLTHNAAFGAIAAVGFGVLFNFGPRALLWCAAAGALALGVRTSCQAQGWSLEAASFVAAATTSLAVIVLRRHVGVIAHAVALAGCIPMVPGAFFGRALIGFFDLTMPTLIDPVSTAVTSIEALARVIFTLGAIGAGLAIPAHLLRSRDF